MDTARQVILMLREVNRRNARRSNEGGMKELHVIVSARTRRAFDFLVRIAPGQVRKQVISLAQYLARSLDGVYVLRPVQLRRQPAVHAEDVLRHQGRDRQAVKHLCQVRSRLVMTGLWSAAAITTSTMLRMHRRQRSAERGQHHFYLARLQQVRINRNKLHSYEREL